MAKYNLGEGKLKKILGQRLLPAELCGVLPSTLPGPAQHFAHQPYFACICCSLWIAPICALG